MDDLKKKILDLIRDEANQKGLSLEDVVAGLTLKLPDQDAGLSPAKRPGSGELEFDGYREVEIDNDTNRKMSELKAITEGIDQRLLPSINFESAKTYRIPYESELNPMQLAAVMATSFPLLVIAGAGSGKTRVITYKVSWLIENGIHPSQILLLTFTRKAANEMLTRVEKLLGDKSVSNVLGGTFHSFSNYILRQYANLVGIPSNFTIIDTEDSADIIDLLRNELKMHATKGGRPFPKKDRIQEIISRSRNLELPIIDTIVKYFEDQVEFVDVIEKLNLALTAYKRAANLMDYDDLMTVLRDKLHDNEVFRNKLRERIRYVWWMNTRIPIMCSAKLLSYCAQAGQISLSWAMTRKVFMLSGVQTWKTSFVSRNHSPIAEWLRSKKITGANRVCSILPMRFCGMQKSGFVKIFSPRNIP